MHPLNDPKSEIIQAKDHYIFSDKNGNHDIMLLQLHNIKGTHKIILPTKCPKQPSAFKLKWFGCFYGATYKYPLKNGDPIRVGGHGRTLPTKIGADKSEFSIIFDYFAFLNTIFYFLRIAFLGIDFNILLNIFESVCIYY